MAQCPICLDEFKVDEAHIPDLQCKCALIVHLDCWIPWSGGCLYCREELEEYEEPIVIVRQYVNPGIRYVHPADAVCIVTAIMVVYFLIILIYDI